jgi:hypothetical protein
VAIAQRTTWIEMLGHRNGTQLAFETGTLNCGEIDLQVSRLLGVLLRKRPLLPGCQ